MKLLCLLLNHKWKQIAMDKRQGKYFFIEECQRCYQKREIPSVVNNMKVKCTSSCPTCHGKS